MTGADLPGDGGADANGGERWVFGYGSLMWRPGFPFLERRAARLHGFHRAFCIFSVHHRGTPERPGLVLGLAAGGEAAGAAFRVAQGDWPGVRAYLLEREQPTETYVEARHQVALAADGPDPARSVQAVLFLSDTAHPQWAGELTLAEQARRIAGARGLSGRNVDYLRDLVRHLDAAGASDPAMLRLLAAVERREAG